MQGHNLSFVNCWKYRCLKAHIHITANNIPPTISLCLPQVLNEWIEAQFTMKAKKKIDEIHPLLSQFANINFSSLSFTSLLFHSIFAGLPQDTYSIWWPYSYPLNQSFCILQGLLSETSTNATVLTITSFTIERYIAICHPFRFVEQWKPYTFALAHT